MKVRLTLLWKEKYVFEGTPRDVLQEVDKVILRWREEYGQEENKGR